jgi:Ca2+-binding RTX toxin-like protein
MWEEAAMASFGTTAITYHEDRADGGFAWDARYNLSFLNSESLTTLRIDLVGDDPGAIAAQWKAGINDIWNNKVCFSDGSRLYEVKLKCVFVDTGAHHTVNVHAGTGITDLKNWYLSTPGGWPDHMHDEIAAHEAGHMFGNFDEFADGATSGGFTRTGTLMSDLTLSGFEDYFRTQEFYTEQLGRMSLGTVLASTGTASANTLNGGSGMDGFYGMAGHDTISGGEGNDLIDGGAGVDRMTGGTGSDIFDFDSSGEAGDVITDFTHLVDAIDLSGMDASSALAGNNAFAWWGTGAFGTGAGGELRYAKFNNAGTTNDYTIVYGDRDCDTGSEFQIRLRGLVNLSSADFYA